MPPSRCCWFPTGAVLPRGPRLIFMYRRAEVNPARLRAIRRGSVSSMGKGGGHEAVLTRTRLQICRRADVTDAVPRPAAGVSRRAPGARGGRAGALLAPGDGLGHRHGGAELWGTGIPGRPPVPDGGADRPAVHRPGAPADFEAGLLRRGHRRPGRRAPLGGADRGAAGEDPHQGHAGRGQPGPGGAAAAGHLSGDGGTAAAGHGLRRGQPGGPAQPGPRRGLPLCGHPLLPHPVRLLLLHLRRCEGAA